MTDGQKMKASGHWHSNDETYTYNVSYFFVHIYKIPLHKVQRNSQNYI